MSSRTVGLYYYFYYLISIVTNIRLTIKTITAIEATLQWKLNLLQHTVLSLLEYKHSTLGTTVCIISSSYYNLMWSLRSDQSINTSDHSMNFVWSLFQGHSQNSFLWLSFLICALLSLWTHFSSRCSSFIFFVKFTSELK